jgi:predicted ATP-grasp superfamily ATP-dependent carboligase
VPKVFVTDAAERAALAVIRSLGKRNIEVTAGDFLNFNTGFLSKYCRHKILYPSPERDCQMFVKTLLKFFRKEKYDLLIPITDLTATLLSKYKEEFEPYVDVGIPSYDVAMNVFDKARTIRIAVDHNIPCPQTFLVEDIESVKTIANEVKYPAVIKPRSKVLLLNNSAVTMKVTAKNYVYDPESLIANYTELISQHEELVESNNLPLIQECVSGIGYGLEALMDRSGSRATFLHKRLREYPATGGASTLRISVKNMEMQEIGLKMLKALNWYGVAMVEFKIDRRDWKPKLIEVNGRFWGSLPLAIASGIDFPYLLYKMMKEGNTYSQIDYEIGVMRRWLLPGDLLWILTTLRYGHARLQAIKDFFASFSVPDDIVSVDDFLPFFGTANVIMHDFIDVLNGYRTISGETKSERSC